MLIQPLSDFRQLRHAVIFAAFCKQRLNLRAVKDRYMEPALSLDDVCADLGVSNSYFSSIFKRKPVSPSSPILRITEWTEQKKWC